MSSEDKVNGIRISKILCEMLPLPIILAIADDAPGWYNLCLAVPNLARRYVIPNNDYRKQIMQFMTILIPNPEVGIAYKYIIKGTQKLHRGDNDLPAIKDVDGTKQWYQNGIRYRDNDLPAIEHAYGNKEWYQNGRLHRDNDLPAVEHAHGTKEWYQKGK